MHYERLTPYMLGLLPALAVTVIEIDDEHRTVRRTDRRDWPEQENCR